MYIRWLIGENRRSPFDFAHDRLSTSLRSGGMTIHILAGDANAQDKLSSEIKSHSG